MPDLIKVELTWADGGVRRLTGEDAKKWWQMQESGAMLMFTHGLYRGDTLDWEVVKLPDGGG